MSLLNRPTAVACSSMGSSTMIGTSSVARADPFRLPLQPRQPVSYPCPPDPPASLEYGFPEPSTSRFPVSSVRPEAPQKSSAVPPAHPPKLVYPRHDPLRILSQTPPPPPRPYPGVVPAPPVAPGVLADGVLTSKLPSVRQFLEAATIAPPECPPLPADERVLALAALSLYYNPLHPAHWILWNEEQKYATASTIKSVLDTTPMPILPPIAWIDGPENLWVLMGIQGSFAQVLASLPWYATYTPTEPESRMNLRKRKPPAILPPTTTGASGEETVDEEEMVTPPRKRPRTRKCTASRSAEARAKANADDDPATGDSRRSGASKTRDATQAALLLAPDVPPALTKSAKRERIDSPEIVISAADDAVRPDTLDVEEAPELRKSLRQRVRKAKAASSASPASVASTLTPSVPARGLSRARTPSRQSPSVAPESVGGGESGSSTAVSLCDEEPAKYKVTEVVEEVANEEVEEDGVEAPPTKRARTARPRAKSGSRARTTKNKADTIAAEAKTNETVQARPKARSRAKARRR